MTRTYWVVWGLDDRTPFRVPGKRGLYLYVNGIPTKVDPNQRRAFSYVTWTRRKIAASSPWTYDREEAERFWSRGAAFAMRKLLFMLGWGAREGKTLRECYGITRVTRVLKKKNRRAGLHQGNGTEEKNG